VRDLATLDLLYPQQNPRFIRLRVKHDGQTVGWAVMLDTAMRDDKYFGNLRMGSIVDCLARPEEAFYVMAAARRELERRGVDLIVSNQAHAQWVRALEDAGFLHGPSNYFFAPSKQLSAKLAGGKCGPDELFLNRGDGDGPIHL
jgi:hypothetical protein